MNNLHIFFFFFLLLQRLSTEEWNGREESLASSEFPDRCLGKPCPCWQRTCVECRRPWPATIVPSFISYSRIVERFVRFVVIACSDKGVATLSTQFLFLLSCAVCHNLLIKGIQLYTRERSNGNYSGSNNLPVILAHRRFWTDGKKLSTPFSIREIVRIR